MADWRIEFLGGFRAVQGQRVIDHFPTQRTALLFAYLALRPDTRWSREVLAELIWPEATLHSQRHSLRLALSRLRSLLGESHPIVTNRTQVWVSSERISTDVAEFLEAVLAKDLVAARRKFVGPFLPGFYESWVIEEQARLEILYESISASEERSPIPSSGRAIYGREAELAKLAELFQKERLITITGPGGMGKTRLAASFAALQESNTWVSLAELNGHEDIPDAIRRALGVPLPSPELPVLAYVCHELKATPGIFVVLDSAEHLLGPSFNQILAALNAVPNIRVLVTSRVATGGPSEREFQLGPVDASASEKIFRDRSQRVVPGWEPLPESVGRIVELMGGIPLALELGAARAGILSAAEIESGGWIRDPQFGDALGVEPRHRDLSAVIQSSLALLKPSDQKSLEALSAFRGDFDGSAAMAVGDADPATLDRLRRLGLIHSEPGPDQVRFRILEPIRRVLESKAAARNHALYFADWIEENRADELPEAPYHFGSRLAAQDQERFNIQAALEHCLESEEAVVRDAGLRIVSAYWTHWYVNNASNQMEHWAKKLLDFEGTHQMNRASAMLSLGLAIRERGDHLGFYEQITQAIAVLDQGPRDRNLAFAHHLHGFALSDLGRIEESDCAYQKAEASWLALGDRRNYSVTRHNRAMIALDAGDIARSEAFIYEALEIFNEHQSTYLGVGYSTLARLQLGKGDEAGAAHALLQAIEWNRRLGYVRGWAQNVRDYALCEARTGNTAEAIERGEEALNDFRRVGDRHGEATALVALAMITGKQHYADEARALVLRHWISTSHELLKDLVVRP